MSSQESEKRTSPWEPTNHFTPETEKRTSPRKPTNHFTPETPITVGDHVGHGGTVVDCGHGGRGGHGGHGGRGGGFGGRGCGQGHHGLIAEHEYITVTREEWTILSNKVQWFEEMAKKQAITIQLLETKLAESPKKGVDV